MSQNSCCVPGCPVTRKDGVILHRFPNPETDTERFYTWISNIGGEITKLDATIVFGNRRVCHRHFEEIHKYPNNRLCKLAVPVLHIMPDREVHLNESAATPHVSVTNFREFRMDIEQSSNSMICSSELSRIIMECDCDYILPTMDGWEEHYQNCRTVWSKDYGTETPKNLDGTIRLRNKHLSRLKCDFLYHLGLDTNNYDLPAMFGDVKFVCMGGTKYRMKEFAKYITKVMNIPDEGLVNLTKHSHRYAMFKVGPVLSVNHGIGIPSMTILLQEVIKLLSYAKAKDPIIFRIGTSGGLNIPPGSVVVSSWGLNGTLKKSYDIPVMGKIMEIPSIFDTRLNQELLYIASEEKRFSTFAGGTMAADDFYQGQARLDGPFCDYTESDKLSFLNTLVELGVKNIEMEATAFAAFTRQAGVRSADVCVTLVNRLEHDQVTPSKSVLLEWQERPMAIIGKYISKYYEKTPNK